MFRGRGWRGWAVEEDMGGGGENIGGGECLGGGEMEGMGSRGGDGRR